MKLLFCGKCKDVFNMSLDLKICSCGDTGGKYITKERIAIFGKSATVLGFKNNSFSKALQNTPMLGAGFRFDAFVIPLICDTVTHVEKNEFIKN